MWTAENNAYIPRTPYPLTVEMPRVEETLRRFWVNNRASEMWKIVKDDLVEKGWTWPKFLRILKIVPWPAIQYELGHIKTPEEVKSAIGTITESLPGRMILKERSE